LTEFWPIPHGDPTSGPRFHPVRSREGAAPTESTVVRVLYDNNAVYVGVQCLDSDPKAVIGQLTRRDRSTEADRFTS